MQGIKDDLTKMMDQQIEHLIKNFQGIRAGRASVDFLARVVVEAYDQQLPINQLATVSVMDDRTLSVDVWDKSVVHHVEKAINAANLGLSINSSGQSILLSLPLLTSESRKKLADVAKDCAEDAKIAIRNNRRVGMDILKEKLTKKELSEDEYHAMSKQIQDLTDGYTKKIENLLSAKEKDILKV